MGINQSRDSRSSNHIDTVSARLGRSFQNGAFEPDAGLVQRSPPRFTLARKMPPPDPARTIVPAQAAAASREVLPAKPQVVVFGTGGTIAGTGASPSNSATYKPAQVPIDTLLQDMPALADVAHVRGVQVFQIASESITHEHLLALGRQVSSVLKDPAVHGVVITHGTDTLEETAYFLNLVIHSDKPIVIVGSMRPGSSLSADGPLNLRNAVEVAASPEARGRGTLIVMNDEILAARDTSKRINIKTNAFSSQWGALGMVVEGKTYWFRAVTKRHTGQSEFDIDHLGDLADVQIVYGSANMHRGQLAAAVRPHAKAVVYAGTGNGSVPDVLKSEMMSIIASGRHFIRASRVPGGLVLRDAEQPDSQLGSVVSHDLSPQHAAILAAVALNAPRTAAELQQVFYEY